MIAALTDLDHHAAGLAPLLVEDGVTLVQEGEVTPILVVDVDREMTDGEARAIARRVAACLNACDGIGTLALEAGVVGELVDAVRNLRDAIDVMRVLYDPHHPGLARADERAGAVLTKATSPTWHDDALAIAAELDAAAGEGS